MTAGLVFPAPIILVLLIAAPVHDLAPAERSPVQVVHIDDPRPANWDIDLSRWAPPPVVDRYRHPSADVDRWYDVAVEAGWPAADWPRLSCVIHRESRGVPSVYNGRNADRSYGLLQFNMHPNANRSWAGPLLDWDFDRLFDPFTNLSMGRELYDRADQYWGDPWRPWVAQRSKCGRL